MLLNLLRLSKHADQDILKSSSLPLLLIQMVKSLTKNKPTQEIADLVTELVYCLSELSKFSFTKQAGIEPVFMKNLGLIPTLLREPPSAEALLSTLKWFGTLVC